MNTVIYFTRDENGHLDSLSNPTADDRRWWPRQGSQIIGECHLSDWEEGEEVNSGHCIECGAYATVRQLNRVEISSSGEVPFMPALSSRRKYCDCK